MEFQNGSDVIELSKTEQKLLRCLVENRGRSVSRSQLIDTVWQGDAELGAGFSGGVSGEIIPSGNWHYSCKCAEAEHSPHTEGNTETVYGESGPKKCGLQRRIQMN